MDSTPFQTQAPNRKNNALASKRLGIVKYSLVSKNIIQGHLERLVVYSLIMDFQGAVSRLLLDGEI